MNNPTPIVLTIAGSDSGGGAGIQADIKTLNTLKVFGITVITCVTAQNTKEVLSIKKLPNTIISSQIDAVKKDFNISCIKVGMLYDKSIMNVVKKFLKSLSKIPVIIDPVMISKSGDYLLKPDSIDFFKKNILPESFLITPNIHEAMEITGMRKIKTKTDIEDCFKKFNSLGASNVLLKGGHFRSEKKSIDYLNFNNKIYTISGVRYATKNTHGTGCTLSAAISGNIALGMSLLDATKEAKKFINNAIKKSLKIGKGNGPLNHFP